MVQMCSWGIAGIPEDTEILSIDRTKKAKYVRIPSITWYAISALKRTKVEYWSVYILKGLMTAVLMMSGCTGT